MIRSPSACGADGDYTPHCNLAQPAASPVRLQVLQFVHGVVALLAEVPMAEVALQLFLQAAYAASEVAHKETLAYELFEQV